MLGITGYEELKQLIKGTVSEGITSEKNVYLATVTSVEPLRVTNAFFGELTSEHLFMLNNTKRWLMPVISEPSEGHKHLIKESKLNINDIVLILLYQQEYEQKFIILDKVVKCDG